jgi:hypothetical protein
MTTTATPSIEQIEITRYRHEIVADLQHMVAKYCRIIGWEVPEVDERQARQLIFSAIKDSLAEIEDQTKAAA